MSPDILKSLEEIINTGIEDVALPYVKGNSIRIKNYVVRNSRAGWLVYDGKTNTQVARLFCKSSAIALAKSLSEGRNRKTQIEEIDKVIEKNYNDCVFYRNTLDKCRDNVKRAVTRSRFEASVVHTKKARHSLDCIIFRR